MALEAGLNRIAGLCVEVPLLTENSDETNKYTLRPKITFRHAVLTTVVLSGLTKGVMYTEPNVVFLQPPVAPLQQNQPHRSMVFAMNNALAEQPSSCADVANKYDGTGLRGQQIDQSERLFDL